MVADAAGSLKTPLIIRLVVESRCLHHIIAPASQRVQEIDRRVDIAGCGKKVQMVSLLSGKRKSANVPCRSQSQEEKWDRCPAKEHVLIVAALDRHPSATQLDGIGSAERADEMLCAIVCQAYGMVHEHNVQPRTAIIDSAMADIECMSPGKIVIFHFRVDKKTSLAAC